MHNKAIRFLTEVPKATIQNAVTLGTKMNLLRTILLENSTLQKVGAWDRGLILTSRVTLSHVILESRLGSHIT